MRNDTSKRGKNTSNETRKHLKAQAHKLYIHRLRQDPLRYKHYLKLQKEAQKRYRIREKAKLKKDQTKLTLRRLRDKKRYQLNMQDPIKRAKKRQQSGAWKKKYPLKWKALKKNLRSRHYARHRDEINTRRRSKHPFPGLWAAIQSARESGDIRTALERLSEALTRFEQAGDSE